MKITCLGVGEAWDIIPNNSYLVSSKSRKTTMLLDCGFSIPPALWKHDADPSLLDAIFISHPHADHYFGLPALLGRMWQDGRTKPLAIFCGKGMKQQIAALLEAGYKGLAAIITFPITFTEVSPGQKITFQEFKLAFAPTIHPVPNLAVKIECEKKVLCYSGDGQYTEQSELLYQHADLVIHESFTWDADVEGHGKMKELLVMAKRAKIKKIAFTHIRRDVRKQLAMIKNSIKENQPSVPVLFPEVGDMIEV
ncbi:MAG: ribonuclease Z [Candidatus Woesearchaeota archaeon]|nr:ribonuclease Z [Candidatus Woesearchaeota archaeon]